MNEFLKEMKTASESLDEATRALIRANVALNNEKRKVYWFGFVTGNLTAYTHMILKAEKWVNECIEVEEKETK